MSQTINPSARGKTRGSEAPSVPNPKPQTPYDPLGVLTPSHTNITVTNNYVMVIVILFFKTLTTSFRAQETM